MRSLQSISDDYYDDVDSDNFADVVTCQGCGVYAPMSWLNRPHNCFRNESGELEEGGTFQ